jgi:molybdopterin synthase catalytic subunit
VKGINIELTEMALSLEAVLQHVETDAAGGICIFIGTVRDTTQGKTILGLEFEAYRPMAIAEMEKIAQTVMDRWPVLNVAIHHRIGTLGIGEIPVIIAVSAAHRGAAFEACRYCIDTLKETVPIWKKERFTDGEIWVSAHP